MSQPVERLIRREVERRTGMIRVHYSVDELRSRVARRRMWRRVQTALLTLVVVGATASGAFAMTRAFRPGTARHPLGGGRGGSTGERIAFVSDRSGFDEIYTMEPDGSGVLRLTSDGAENRGPAWSPDRTQIAFWHYTEETEGDVYLVDADGGGEHPITSGPERDAYPAWSPDGTKIVFSRDFQIHVMNADGSHVEKLTAIREGADFPSWSPDGKLIAFVGDLGARQSLYVMNPDGSGLTRIYRETQLETGEYLTAGSWSPDGDWILFTRIDTSIGKCSQDDLFRIHPDGTGLTRVTRTRNSAADSWSPGGEKILVERTFGDSCTVEMFTMNADGTGRTQITAGPANNFGGNWGPPSS